MSELHEGALRICGRIPVFPCNQHKRPMTPRGFYDASSDPALVSEWWTRWPDALIGIPTGERSGLVVLDLDAPGEHKADGLVSFAGIRAGRDLPPHPVVRTRSGGEHHYFSNQSPRQVRNRASKMAPGVDQRGQGGYVIVPPSPGYTPIDDTWPPPPPPPWLLDLMAPPPKPPEERKAYTGVPRPMQQFETLVKFAANATEGQRNSRAYWAACRLGEAVALGKLGESAAVAMIAEAAERAGLSKREAALTAASGVKMGKEARP